MGLAREAEARRGGGWRCCKPCIAYALTASVLNEFSCVVVLMSLPSEAQEYGFTLLFR